MEKENQVLKSESSLPVGYAPGRSPIIKNVIPGLPEIGKIKIGKKGETRQKAGGGEWQLPVKLDHFIVTKLERGQDNNFLIDIELHKKLGEKPKTIPIFLPYENLELNFQSRYACYTGKTLWCSGDGCAAFRLQAGKAERVQVSCSCERQSPTYTGTDKCKMHGTLSCIIVGASSIGGVWKFRTTGYNSTNGLLASLAYLQLQTGGHLARIPLKLTIRPKAATNPTDGKPVTIQVVGVEFDGDTAALEKTVVTIIEKDADFRKKLVAVERETQKLLSVDAVLVDEAGDIREEHFPVEQPAGTPLASPGLTPSAGPAPAAEPEKPKRGRKPKQAGTPEAVAAETIPAETLPVESPAEPAVTEPAQPAEQSPELNTDGITDVNLFD